MIFLRHLVGSFGIDGIFALAGVIFIALYKKKEKKKKEKEALGTDKDKDTDTDMDMDTDTDADTNSDMKLANFCLASIWRYSPCSVVWLNDFIPWRKSQQRYELVVSFSNENNDVQTHGVIETVL